MNIFLPYTFPRLPKMADSRAGVDSTVNQIEDQERRLSLSLGWGSDQSIIESATRVLTSAPRHPDYDKFDPVPFVYEKLGGEKTNDAVKMVVDSWTQVGNARILTDDNAYSVARYPGTFTVQQMQLGEMHLMRRRT